MRLHTFIAMSLFTTSVVRTVQGGPPLPLHTVEGNSGVFITSTAYLANPPEEGHKVGVPSVSASAAFLADKDFLSLAITENLFG